MAGGNLEILKDLSAIPEHPAIEQASFDIPTASAPEKDEDKLNTRRIIV